MSESKQTSLSKLAKAREQLRKAQARVAALEMQLSEDQLKPAVSLSLEERYHYTLDNMLEGCQIIGFDWRYLYLNNIAAEQGRQEKTELLGFTMMERYPGIEKSELFNVLQNCMQERTIEQLENRFDYPDGTTGWFELRIQPVPEGLVIFSLDITERKRAEAILHEDEARLRVFVEHAPAAIAMLDTDMKYLLVSHRWLSDYRLSESVVVGRSHYDLFPDIPERWRAIHQRCLKGAVESSDADPFPRADGRLDWVRWEIRPWRKNDGTIGGIFIFSEVITERKEAEEILQRYAQRMEILHLIDKGIINANSIREVVETALKYIRRLIPCQRANVGLIDMTKGEGVIFAIDYDADTALGQGFRVPIRQDLFDGYDDRYVKVVPDLRVLQETNPRFKQAVNEGLLSGLNVILLDHDVPIGTLGLFANTLNFFTAEHQQIIVEVGNQLAIAIRQMRLSDALAAQLETLDQTREFLQTTLDAFPANTTVLDPDGNIVAVNLSWKQFADLNSGDIDQYYLGKNYLEVCDKTVGLNADEAAAAAAGIRAVISGDLPTFQLEYPCHSLTQKRWFVLRVTSFGEQAPRRVVVAHIDITERKQAEAIEHEQRLLAETLRDSLALLTTSLDVETVMQQILAYSGMVISSDAGTIILFEGDRGRVAYSRGYSAEAEAFFNANLIDIDSGVYGRSKDDSTFYLAADTRSTPDWTDFPFTNWVRSSIGVQIVAQDKVIGLLIADSATPNQFQHKDVENLQAFARYAALALENAYHVDQLEDKVEKRTADLQAAKERVEAILNNSPDGILLVDTDLKIQQANASFNRIFSCQPDDYYGKSLVDLIHPEDTNSVKDTLQTVVVERQGKHIEIRASRKDGTVFDVELSIGVVRGDGLVCVIRDISERKRLNRQLQYHASLQENVSDAVIVTDMDLRIQSWNKAATRTYGWTMEEALGKVAPDLLQIRFLSTEDQESGLEQFTKYGFLQQETIQHHKDGTDIFILGSATRLDDDKGIPIGIIALNRDITERKAQERQLRYHASLQESMRDAVFVMDMQFTIQSWNKAAELIYGWTAEEAIGKHADTILRNQISEEENHRLFAQLIEQSWLKFDLIQLHKGGDPLNIWCSMTLIKDIDGHPVGILSVNHDITERKAQERQIRYYASFQEHISDAVIATDTEFHIRSWNKAAERIYGWTADEVMGKTVRDVLHTQLPKGVSREIAKQELADSHEWHNEVRQKHKNGNWLDISASVSHLTDENGALIGEVAVNRDITERKAQERQLQYHASLQASVSDAVIATDMDFRIQSWNRAAETIYGWRATETIGKFANEILQTTYESEADRARILQDFLERGAWQGEVIQHHRDGTPINILASANLFKDETGQPFGVVSVNRDITDRKRVAEALQKSAAEIHDLYNSAPCGYHSIDKDGLIVQINDTELQWLGYTRDEVVGRLKATFLFTPESVLVFQRTFPVFTERGWLNDLELDMVRKDGSIMHILLNATAIYDEHGQFLRSRSTIFDITELRQTQQAIIASEERYRLLAENIADMIMTFSLDRLITYMSPSCERILGYLPEEVEGKSHSEFIHSEDYPQVIDRTRQAVASKENFYTNQFRLRHKAGHYIWYEVRTRIVFDHDTGNVVQFISVLRDITERKQAEAQLQKSEERLRTIIENIPVMLSFFDVEGRFEFVNQCWLDQVGWTLEDLTTAEEPLTLFYPDPEYRQHVLEYMLSAEPGWRDFNSQTKHRGERITSWANVRLSDGRGIGIGQDVTEHRRAEAALRESEERFRRAIINAPFPIMIHADDGEVLHISNAWAEISGYTHADIPTMTIWLEKAHGENSHIIRAGIEKIYTLTKPQRGGEFLIRTKSGEQRIWDFISAPLALMPDGRRMVSSMAVDITERKHAEDVLKEKMEEDHQFQSYLKALHEIIIELTGIDELEAFYKRAVELGRERLGFERLAMFLYDEQSGSAIGTFGTDTQGNLVDERGIRFKPDPNGVMQCSFERAERFYFNEQVTLFNEEVSVGTGWNVAAVLWNGAQSLGWFVADNLLSHAPASKSLLDIIGLYALSIGTLLAQKQTRIALKESEALYRLLAENINDLIMRSTFTGECLYISPSVQTILGYAPEELIGQPIFDLIYPDDQATIWEAYASALERNDLIMPHQYRAKHKDGRYIWLEMVGKPLLMDGTKEVYGVITSSRNITERKQAEDALRESEEKLRLFIESAPMATLISDKLGRIILLNHETEKLFGYARNELLGKSIDELIPDEMRKAHIDLRSQYISGTIERRTHGVEAPAVHKNGTVFPAEVQLSHIDLSDGPIVISSVIDITARKQAEETLRQALAKEKELGELKSRFVSMASHEFRTPLASILAVTETLMAYRYQLSDDQIDEKFSKIKAQIQHLKDIMEDVLLLARMQSRRVEFRPVPVDIDSLCRSVLDEFQSRTDVHHQLDYRCGDGIREIKLDRKLMRQVISNLVSNAIKYSPIDKPIQISLECSDEVFILKVQDEGIGIPEADLQHLFEAFHRASNVGAISGTGLGLVITKEAVELHGGSITVDSYAGMGTTFTVRIPTSRKGDNENDENSSY